MKSRLLLVVLALATSALAHPFQLLAFSNPPSQQEIILEPWTMPFLSTSSADLDGIFFQMHSDIPRLNVWQATVQLPGYQGTEWSGSFNCTGVTYGNCAVDFEWFNLPVRYHPTEGEVLLSVDGIQDSYPFQYAMPTPEPSSLWLMAGGLSAALVALRRMK